MLEHLKNAAKAGKLAHGYLFYGGSKNEMKNTALSFADFLKTDHFDILYIAPEQGKKDISIDQIKQIKKHLSLSPYNSFYKFVIIDGAETMNEASANALLKTLEEPQGNAILILIAPAPDFLSKTILSRLQEIKFKPISLDKLAKDYINQEYVEILKKPLNDIFKYIEKTSKDCKEKKDDSEFINILDSWLLWFREMLISDIDDIDKTHQPKAGPPRAEETLKVIREIQKTRNLISATNVNPRLALENLVLCINNY